MNFNFFKINDFEPKTFYLEIVLGIGGGSPMKESDLLMTASITANLSLSQ